MKQSDWCCQWKSGEVKGHKRWWPEQLPNILSVKQVPVSDATWPVETGGQSSHLVEFALCEMNFTAVDVLASQ